MMSNVNPPKRSASEIAPPAIRSTRKQAAAFAKTRRDHATETAEDYVEAIEDILAAQPTCRVKDLALRMDVSHVTVTRILQRLATDGLIDKVPYGPCTLTAQGRQLARRSRERHEVMLAFLLALGVPPTDAQRDAEGMEHHVSRATLTRIRAFLESQASQVS